MASQSVKHPHFFATQEVQLALSFLLAMCHTASDHHLGNNNGLQLELVQRQTVTLDPSVKLQLEAAWQPVQANRRL